MSLIARIAAVLMVCTAGTAAAQTEVRLTSIEWPPYSGAALPEGGASVALARAAFAAEGMRLTVTFLPFRRAVEDARRDPTIVGYFPEYAEVEADFTPSVSFGLSPLGFAQLAQQPFTWTTVADLTAVQPIGVVTGYINETAFDLAVKERRLTVDTSNDDVANLRKMALGRLRAAVIDRHVLAYLLANDPSLASARTAITFNPRLLEEKTLHIAFRSAPHGQAAAAAFARGLAKIDRAAIDRRFLTN